jgi:hypothetical protein
MSRQSTEASASMQRGAIGGSAEALAVAALVLTQPSWLCGLPLVVWKLV